jgi:hypothetical protein
MNIRLNDESDIESMLSWFNSMNDFGIAYAF